MGADVWLSGVGGMGRIGGMSGIGGIGGSRGRGNECRSTSLLDIPCWIFSIQLLRSRLSASSNCSRVPMSIHSKLETSNGKIV